MNRLVYLLASLPLLLAPMMAAHAGNFQPVMPLFSGSDMQPGSNPAAGMPIDLNATFDRALGQITVNAPGNAVSFDQLQNVISQFPGADKLQVLFPNQASWSTTPADLLSLHNQFLTQALSMGLGSNGLNLPQMAFSSLASGDEALSQYIPGGANGLAMIPIATMKGAMSDTLEPVLRAARDQQMAVASWMPEWLKNTWLAVYNFFVPYYDSTVSWVTSFF